jgi:PmbA protein
MSSLDSQSLLDLAVNLMERAQKRGVDVAEAQARAGWELTTKVRLGETELVQEAGQRSVYLRVFRDQRVALTSTSDISTEGLDRCVADAMELLDLSEPDPFAGPVDSALLGKAPFVDLDLYDPGVEVLDAAAAIERARRGERAALDADPRISLSEGATFSRVTGGSGLALSSGFLAHQRGSYVSFSVAPVAIDVDGKRRRGHHWAARRHLAELENEEAVGREAARRTLRQLGPRKVPTCEAPVIFDRDAARSIVGTFAGCILGGALWRKSSYLLDRLGSAVASELVTFVDNPLMPRAPGSRAFDGEGLPSRVNTVVKNGQLLTYLLDSYSARKLGSSSTASASRGGASVGASTTNFVMQAGTLDPAALVASTPRGLLVTEMMGFGFNAVTGDFSRGASGFWIENGEIAFPVSELTISGNLNQMLLDVDAVANDLDFQTSTAAPTFRVAKMTIGGT